LLAVGGCALVAGCASGKSSHFPDLLSTGEIDPHTRRIVLRPEQCTAPVRGTQVLIATVYDDEGRPRRNRRVEWTIEGPGNIVEVGQGGYLPGRGAKGDTKFAHSDTESSDRRIKRRDDDFTVGPGQTWCLVSNAVEGETTVTAHCPAIKDADLNRAEARIGWLAGDLRFPPAVTTRAGGEYTLNTTVLAPPDRTAGYRVRYRIVDGPAAALTADRGGPVSSVTEAVAPIEEDGSGRVQITQPLPVRGTTRVAIEIEKPDPAHRGQYLLVTKGETRVTWEAPHLDVSVSAPKALGVNQDAIITYSVAGKAEGALTLTARVPDEMVIIRTEPKAAIDGPTLIWTLPAAGDGKPPSVTAVLRPVRLGSAELTAEARTADGLTGRGSVSATIAEPKLHLKLDGPATGLAGEPLPFRVTVTNAGDWAAERIRIQGRFDDGLETSSKANTLDETIPAIAAGQSKTIPLPLTARRGGKFKIEVAASGDRNLTAVPQLATVEVKEVQLSLSAHGPARGYVGQEAIWQFVVQNTGDVPLKNVVVKATLPAEVAFSKATDGGKASGKQVVWNLGSLAARQPRTIAVTGICNKVTGRAIVTAKVSASPNSDGGKVLGADRPAEAPLEIVGVPALQLSVKDSADPVAVGERTTYLIRVKNTGSQAARKIEVIADLPDQMRPTRGTGPGAASKIAAQRVTFPALDSLAPGAEASFVVEAAAVIAGEAQCRVEVRSATQKEALQAVEPTRIVAGQGRPIEP
jgi:uncharacterized repeat protein (TIGR01451 family)